MSDVRSPAVARPREDEWQRWCARFDQAHNGVIRLFHDRSVWRTIRQMIDTNSAVHQTGIAENWLAWCYTTTQLIGIRRECAGDRDSVGYRRLLNGLASNPRMATRSWYKAELRIRGIDGEDLDRLSADFDRFTQPASPFVDSRLILDDLERLETVVAKAENYTNKMLAHRTDKLSESGAIEPPPITWEELDTAINTIGQIHRKYYRLRFPATDLWHLTPLTHPGWDRMFDTAWKAAGFVPLDDLSFET
jgi:hypothetical protein